MYVSKKARAKNAFISIVCAFAIAFSLITPFHAFGNLDFGIDNIIKLQSAETLNAETLNAEGLDAEGLYADALDAEGQSTSVDGSKASGINDSLDLAEADEPTNPTDPTEPTNPPATSNEPTNPPTQDDPPLPVAPADPVTPGTGSSEPGQNQPVVPEPPKSPEPTTNPASGKISVTFYGAEKKTIEIDKGATIGSQLVTPPTTATFSLWCGTDVAGVFKGWSVGRYAEPSPKMMVLPLGASLADTPQASVFYWEEASISTANKSILIYKDGELAPEMDERWASVTASTVLNESVELFPVYHNPSKRLTLVYGTEFIDGEVEKGGDDWDTPIDHVFTEADVAYLINHYQSRSLRATGIAFQGLAATVNPNGSATLVGKTPQDLFELNDGLSAFYVFFTKRYEASNEEIKLPPVQVSGKTGVKAYGNINGRNAPYGANIIANAETVTSGPDFDKLKKATGAKRVGDVFDIRLIVNDAEIHNEFGELTIALPIDEKYNDHKIIVRHLHQDGNITTIDSVAKGGFVNFAVTDLSLFSMEDGGVATPKNEKMLSGLSKTGETNQMAILTLIVLIACASGAIIYCALNARAEKRNKRDM